MASAPQRLRLPVDLILVRHGQSEGNVAVRASREGDDSFMLHPEFRDRHASHWRLTDLGISQAKAAGEWLREHLHGLPRRYYVSPYARALETAAHMGFDDPKWRVDIRLREREYGREGLVLSAERTARTVSSIERRSSPFFWRPLNGESLADVSLRLRDFEETLRRDTDAPTVIVCHREVMEAFWINAHHATPATYLQARKPGGTLAAVSNGHVFHFTRRDVDTGKVHRHFRWWRSICTHDPSWGDSSWQPIRRRTFSNDELLEMADATPRLIHGAT